MERNTFLLSAGPGQGKTVTKAVKACTDADILAQDIFDREGRRILSANTAVNGYVKSLLILNGTDVVGIGGSGLFGEERGQKPAFSFQDEVRNIFLILASGQKIEYERLERLAVPPGFKDSRDQVSAIRRLTEEMRQYDLYTYAHCISVSFYSMLLAAALGLPDLSVRQAAACGLLHDVGKMSIPKELLNKPGVLSVSEHKRIEQHVTLGYRVLRGIDAIDGRIKKAVLLHHERMDGSGYPFGIIPDEPLTKIVAVADVYDAIISDRVYKKREHPFEAFEFFTDEGARLFDRRILNAFLSNFSAMLIGATVRLTSGETARIVYIPPEYPCRMIIEKGCRYADLYDLDKICGILPVHDCGARPADADCKNGGRTDCRAKCRADSFSPDNFSGSGQEIV
jgi:uncharacterized domain HDIG